MIGDLEIYEFFKRKGKKLRCQKHFTYLLPLLVHLLWAYFTFYCWEFISILTIVEVD